MKDRFQSEGVMFWTAHKRLNGLIKIEGKIMREEGKSPITMWLAGSIAPNPFGTVSVAFKIRREMSNSAGRLQAGMFNVFAREAIHQFDVNSGSEPIAIGAMATEIFELPAVGEHIFAHIKKTLRAVSVNMYNADKCLIARVIIT